MTHIVIFLRDCLTNSISCQGSVYSWVMTNLVRWDIVFGIEKQPKRSLGVIIMLYLVSGYKR